jgi:uncharacterized repeat protein (TIGR03803 family)
VLYSFAGGTDGAMPTAGLTRLDGVLYGTTYGTNGNFDGSGSVFSISKTGVKTTLYSFPGNPNGPTIGSLVKVGDALYGTVYAAGNSGCFNGCGSIFKITPDGALTTVYSFTGGADGGNPISLTKVGKTLYGLTLDGFGTVFKLDATGALSTVYTFQGPNTGDGFDPYGALIYVDGALYGTTNYGGAPKQGYGVVFEVTPQGQETVLHVFEGADGKYPAAGLTDVGGVLYGTTQSGGAYGSGLNGGTVFSIMPDGSAFNTVYNFGGYSTDGNEPDSALLDVNGVLYGTTAFGGSGGLGGIGMVFSVTPDGVENTVYDFGADHDNDGNEPYGSLLKVGGAIYGTTTSGGTDGYGTVYKISGIDE